MGDYNFCRGHVYYFEPNDMSYGKDQDGENVPLMPHLEDMCISMSLTAEIFRRDDKNCLYTIEDKNNVKKIQKTISWISYSGQNTIDTMKLSQQIANDGENFGGEKYLTTYYTEISADQYIENELIQGLGVTNVDISFESWYTPTVTIKFIDIHGSSLWGREEAIHDNNRITSDNILGVFFTQPYPLFRLQIKGFLGQSVTYQLTVSSFKGNYNSQTGNFEITVTFIGYSYSLLTDIPLTLLSCVSEMNYVGKQYWNSHVSSPQWALKKSDGTFVTPTPLFTLIENIRSAVGSFESTEDLACDLTPTGTKSADDSGKVKSAVEKDQVVPLSTAKKVSDATKTNTELSEVDNALKEFLNECETFCNSGFVIYGKSDETENSEEQVLLVPGNDGKKAKMTIKPNGDSLRTKYIAFNDSIEKFNKSNPNETLKNEISDKNPYDFHKTITTAKQGEFSFNCDKIFTISSNSSTKKTSAVIYQKNAGKAKEIKDLKISGIRIYKTIASELQKKVDEFNEDKIHSGDGFGSYAFLLPLGKIRADLQHRFKVLNDTANTARIETENKEAAQSNSAIKLTQEQKKELEERRRKAKEKFIEQKILDVIGFEPTVGNFVKLLMCHLETFAEVMFKCAENIVKEQNNGKRLPSQMGFVDGLKSTDIPDSNTSARGVGMQNDFKKPIFAWPTLYKKKNDTNSETSSKTQYEVLGCPIDYTPKKGHSWEEVKVLTSFMDAIARCNDRLEKQNTKQTFKYINSIPMSTIDLNGFDSPFRFVAKECKNIENLASYLGIRIAQIIGLSDNKCSKDVAEAIGSIDAINLITSFSDPDALYNAILSKDGNTIFGERVLDYITCNNKTLSTSELENGNQFNLFETQVGKNYYNKNRHSIFVKDNDCYKYSYFYTPSTNGQEMVSLVPADLLSFNGYVNPYGDLFKSYIIKNSTEDLTSYYPDVKSDGKQFWVHLANSNNVEILSPNANYQNDFMFKIISEKFNCDTLESQINSLKEGQIKISNYTVKGAKEDENVKRFIEQRYKFEPKDYQQFYFGSKNYRIIGPSIYDIDSKYATEHLVFSNAQNTQITFDKEWLDSSSELGKKIALTKNEDEISYKCGDKNLKADNVYIHDLPFKRNGNVISSLFGNEIFYAQNNIKNLEFRNKAKLYLIVSSMMSGIESPEKDLFKSDDTSVIKKFPPFYVLFIGGLLWRKSLNDDEDLDYGPYNETFPDRDTSLISKSDKIMCLDTKQKCDWLKIEDYYMPYKEIDPIVKNKLIAFFETYSKTVDFAYILKQCELLTNENEHINSTKWNELKSKWSKSSFNGNNPEHWKQIFGLIYDRISAFSLSDDSQSFSLLFNQTYDVLGSLERLYGLGNSIILSRMTTKRIGKNDNVIKLVKEQIFGYLKGFEERIIDYKNTRDSEKDDEGGGDLTTYDRDIMVNMYYNLQHVWNSWLMTSSRDQFTIENFFNKYFVFIDSFYQNVYNEIKLNVQTISDAYNTKDISLLSFLENVTSKAGMMLFALPDFVDSNIYKNSTVNSYLSKNGKNNFEWGKENLSNLFKPIPFNEQNPPKVNNVFVFIYTHKFSDNALENTDKRFDSYMINNSNLEFPSSLASPVIEVNGDRIFDANDETDIVKPNNTLNDSDEQLISGRHGYWMPCFGIAVNRGNNYIFKTINVNMVSPKVTSISAQTWENILTKTGSDASKRVNFHGQDIYAIYSQYAYACEIEMIGCAQIQPLMYFQLLNIPMWRGTYMIYKVQHSISPGTMSTKFTGMKMSRYQTPYATGYFTLSKEAVSKPTKVSSNDNKEETKTDTSNDTETKNSGGTWYVGGPKMIQAIFGDYTGYKYKKNGDDYDQPRGQTCVERDKDGKCIKKGGQHWHQGIDIFGAEGTPLHAPWDGYIDFAYTNAGAAGNYLMIVDNSKQNAVVYMHNKELKVKKGDKVKAGQIVSLLGHTGGNATADNLGTSNHLHLELYVNGKLTRGESTRHGGKGQHVNPTTEFGTIGPVESIETKKDGTKNESLLKTNKNGKANCVMVGDSWGVGLGGYFKYSVAISGEHLKRIYNEFLPVALKTDANNVVFSCGLNDASQAKSTLKSFYVNMGKACKNAGKKCYICTFPPLKYPSGYNNVIKEENINKLNQAIREGKSDGGYTVIEIGNITSNGTTNIGSDGFHLSPTGWAKMAVIINSKV